MWQRHWTRALVLAAAASGLIGGCGKSGSPAPSGANPTANAAVQMNIAAALPAVLGADNLQSEIDNAAAGVKLVRLDLSSVGLPLTLDAPEGAKVERDPRALSLRRDAGDVEVTAGDHFAIRIRLGKHPFDQKRQQLSGQNVLINNKDLVLSASLLLLDERYEFVRHVVAGLQDYTVENVDPLFGQQINHGQADCLLMLKCVSTLAAKMPPPTTP